MKSVYTLTIIALVALIIGWWQLDKETSTQLLVTKDEHFVDAYMQTFTLTAMNQQGKPGYTLKAKRMDHFNDSDVSNLSEPVFVFPQADGNWQVSAKNGEIDDAHNHLVLKNNVVMQQLATEGNTQATIRLETNSLSIDTREQLASTDSPVKIYHHQLELQSQGMRFDNLKGKLELLADVEGVYARAN